MAENVNIEISVETAKKRCRCQALPYCVWRSPDESSFVPLEVSGDFLCTNDLPCANQCDNCAYSKDCTRASTVLVTANLLLIRC